MARRDRDGGSTTTRGGGQQHLDQLSTSPITALAPQRTVKLQRASSIHRQNPLFASHREETLGSMEQEDDEDGRVVSPPPNPTDLSTSCSICGTSFAGLDALGIHLHGEFHRVSRAQSPPLASSPPGQNIPRRSSKCLAEQAPGRLEPTPQGRLGSASGRSQESSVPQQEQYPPVLLARRPSTATGPVRSSVGSVTARQRNVPSRPVAPKRECYSISPGSTSHRRVWRAVCLSFSFFDSL